jgi:putative transcriptional regulator
MEFRLGKRVTIKDVSEGTGINRVTLSKIINQKGYSTTTENIDKLCDFFDCEIQDLMQKL